MTCRYFSVHDALIHHNRNDVTALFWHYHALIDTSCDYNDPIYLNRNCILLHIGPTRTRARVDNKLLYVKNIIFHCTSCNISSVLLFGNHATYPCFHYSTFKWFGQARHMNGVSKGHVFCRFKCLDIGKSIERFLFGNSNIPISINRYERSVAFDLSIWPRALSRISAIPCPLIGRVISEHLHRNR